MDEPQLQPTIRISVEDTDPDYTLVTISAASFRFAGTTRVYLGPQQLAKLATTLSGFPSSTQDRRTVEFGSIDLTAAGGYFAACFASGSTGAGTVSVRIKDDPRWSAAAEASFSFQVMAAEVDAFVAALGRLARTSDGEALLIGCERFSSGP